MITEEQLKELREIMTEAKTRDMAFELENRLIDNVGIDVRIVDDVAALLRNKEVTFIATTEENGIQYLHGSNDDGDLAASVETGRLPEKTSERGFETESSTENDIENSESKIENIEAAFEEYQSSSTALAVTQQPENNRSAGADAVSGGQTFAYEGRADAVPDGIELDADDANNQAVLDDILRGAGTRFSKDDKTTMFGINSGDSRILRDKDGKEHQLNEANCIALVATAAGAKMYLQTKNPAHDFAPITGQAKPVMGKLNDNGKQNENDNTPTPFRGGGSGGFQFFSNNTRKAQSKKEKGYKLAGELLHGSLSRNISGIHDALDNSEALSKDATKIREEIAKGNPKFTQDMLKKAEAAKGGADKILNDKLKNLNENLKTMMEEGVSLDKIKGGKAIHQSLDGLCDRLQQSGSTMAAGKKMGDWAKEMEEKIQGMVSAFASALGASFGR